MRRHAVGEKRQHGLAELRRAVEEIAAQLPCRGKPLVIAVRSTVFPGTSEEAVLPSSAYYPDVRVASNPEFLREGSAVRDFFEPSLVVVGADDPAAARTVAGLHAPLGVPPCLVSLRAAEMIKYACNAFHAAKISFANEIGALCERLDMDSQEVMANLCRDVKLNVSPRLPQARIRVRWNQSQLHPRDHPARRPAAY